MQDRKMAIATATALIGSVMIFVSMLQTLPLTLRYIGFSVLIVCEAVFLVSFLTLGARG